MSGSALLVGSQLATLPASAASNEQIERQIEALKREFTRELDLLKQQLEKQKEAAANKTEEVEKIKQELSGVKEAAIKPPYDWTKSISFSLGGYTSAGYSTGSHSSRTFDSADFVPLITFTYKDIVMGQAELENSITADGGTDVSLEQANLTFFPADHVAIVVGKFLSPLGQFQQNYHPKWINKMVSRPVGFGEDATAAPLANLGLQVRGDVPVPGINRLTYAAFVANAPNLQIDAATGELDSISNRPAVTSPNNKMVYGGRISVFPIPSLEIGASGAGGQTAIVANGATGKSRDYLAYGLDFTWIYSQDFNLRGEWIAQRVGSVGEETPGLVDALAGVALTTSGGRWSAGYLQAGYTFLPKWEAVLRVGRFDAPKKEFSQSQIAAGIDYWFAPSVVGKMTYELNRGQSGTAAHGDRLLLQAVYGF